MDVLIKDFIRYNVLDSITRHTITPNMRTLNIFINFDWFFQTYKNPLTNKKFQSCGTFAPKQFTSTVLNMMGHYRQWGTRHRLDTRVYGYMTTERRNFENSLYYPDFRKYYINKSSLSYTDVFYVNNCINNAVPMITAICNHIDGVYFLDSHSTDPSVIPYFVSREIRDADWNFIVTNDRLDFQYVNQPKFSILCPLHKDKDDISKQITKHNLAAVVRETENLKDISKVADCIATLYLLCLGVCGDQHRSLPNITGYSFRRVIQKFESIAKSCKGVFTTERMAQEFLSTFSQSNMSLETLNTNMKVANIIVGYNSMSESSRETIKSQIIDIPDYENLKELNMNPDFFVNCPINLEFLTGNI